MKARVVMMLNSAQRCILPQSHPGTGGPPAYVIFTTADLTYTFFITLRLNGGIMAGKTRYNAPLY